MAIVWTRLPLIMSLISIVSVVNAMMYGNEHTARDENKSRIWLVIIICFHSIAKSTSLYRNVPLHCYVVHSIRIIKRRSKKRIKKKKKDDTSFLVRNYTFSFPVKSTTCIFDLIAITRISETIKQLSSKSVFLFYNIHNDFKVSLLFYLFGFEKVNDVVLSRIRPFGIHASQKTKCLR